MKLKNWTQHKKIYDMHFQQRFSFPAILLENKSCLCKYKLEVSRLNIKTKNTNFCFMGLLA